MNYLNQKVTMFKGVTGKDHKNYAVKSVLTAIKEGKFAKSMHRIRSTEDEEQRSELKKKLIAVTFSGMFDGRSNEDLVSHSGLICLDFDKVGAAYKETLIDDEYIFAAFVSPSGNGVKALVKVDVKDSSEHVATFEALKKRFVKVDKSGRNVSRLCFMSYDPDLYINEDSKVFTDRIAQPTRTKKVERKTGGYGFDFDDYFNNYLIIKRWSFGRGYDHGEKNRNNTIADIAFGCNRVGIPKEIAYEYLTNDFMKGADALSKDEFDKTFNHKYDSYTDQFGIARIQDDIMVDIKTGVEVKDEPVDENKPLQGFRAIGAMSERIIHRNRHGVSVGETTHFLPLNYDPVKDKYNPRDKTGVLTFDDIFRWKRGEINVLYGIGNHGKSAFLNQLMLLKAVNDDYRWAVFSPEWKPQERFGDDLMKRYVGKNKLSAKDVREASAAIGNSFFLMDVNYDKLSVGNILNKLAAAVRTKKVTGIVIDPFSWVERPNGMNEYAFMMKVMPELNKFAVQENVVLVVVTHTNHNTGEKKDGVLNTPWYQWSIQGGESWGRFSDNIILYHRPNFKNDPTDPTAIVSTQKIKEQDGGTIPGTIEVRYMRETMNFIYEQDYVTRSTGYGFDLTGGSMVNMNEKRMSEVPQDIEDEIYDPSGPVELDEFEDDSYLYKD